MRASVPFTGADTFTVDFQGEGVSHVETVTVHVGEELTEAEQRFDLPLDGVLNGVPLDLSDPATAELVTSLREQSQGEGVEPTMPVPSTPAPGPSAPTIPTDPSTPAAPVPSTLASEPPVPSTTLTDDGAHEVPDKVQTGDGVNGVLVVIAVVGAAVLGGLRRRVGLAH